MRRPSLGPAGPATTAAVVGLVTAGTAVGVGELVAAAVRPEASPVVAVANRVITLTPGSAARTAIDAVGTNDKVLLVGGILVTLAVAGLVVGRLAVHRLRSGLAGVAVVGATGCYCALTAHAARASDVVPSLVATLASAGVLVLLVRLARHRPTGADGPDASAPDRRLFLQSAGTGAALAAVAGFGGRALQHARFDVAADRDRIRLPEATGETGATPRGADLGKSRVPWTTPNGDFYRIDTAVTVPQLSSGSWRLRIHGMVDHPTTIDYEQLLARPMVERWMTLCCVSNEVGGTLVGNAHFRGALLADLLREAGVQDAADQLLMTSVDGMTIGAPAKVVLDGRAALLAVGMNGEPLPVAHGFPVRVVVPGLYGYVSACKWVTSIEATTFAERSAYWVQQDWATATSIRLASRIDRPTEGTVLPVGEIAVVAGVAWDQHVGVSRVQVRVTGPGVDDPWRDARLATVPSSDTWRQWVLPWTPPRSGDYTLTVRAVDGEGRVQDETFRDPFPSGSTGLHSVPVRAVI